MMREAAELAERGHVDEAAELKREAMGVLEQAKHRDRPMPPNHPEIMRLRERLESLEREAEKLEDSDANEERLDDIRREAERVERELQELSHHEHPLPRDRTHRHDPTTSHPPARSPRYVSQDRSVLSKLW